MRSQLWGTNLAYPKLPGRQLPISAVRSIRNPNLLRFPLYLLSKELYIKKASIPHSSRKRTASNATVYCQDPAPMAKKKKKKKEIPAQ